MVVFYSAGLFTMTLFRFCQDTLQLEYFSDLANWSRALIYFTMYGTLLAAFSLASCSLCAIAVNHNQHGDELLESGGNSINDYID